MARKLQTRRFSKEWYEYRIQEMRLQVPDTSLIQEWKQRLQLFDDMVAASGRVVLAGDGSWWFRCGDATSSSALVSRQGLRVRDVGNAAALAAVIQEWRADLIANWHDRNLLSEMSWEVSRYRRTNNGQMPSVEHLHRWMKRFFATKPPVFPPVVEQDGSSGA